MSKTMTRKKSVGTAGLFIGLFVFFLIVNRYRR